MGFAKEAVVGQLINMFVLLVCLAADIWAYYWDGWSNNHREQLVQTLINKKANLLSAEDAQIVYRGLLRELDYLLGSIWVWGLVFFFSVFHFILCFAIRNIQYRKTFNICFHLGASVVVLGGLAFFGISFGKNNENFDKLFRDTIGKVDAKGNRLHNPCYFPPPPNNPAFHVSEYYCQERYTKVAVMCAMSLNCFFYWITAYFIGCFVDVDDSAELLYAELASELPPLRSLASLPPLPYYARPLHLSPTSKRRNKRLNRVEVAA